MSAKEYEEDGLDFFSTSNQKTQQTFGSISATVVPAFIAGACFGALVGPRVSSKTGVGSATKVVSSALGAGSLLAGVWAFSPVLWALWTGEVTPDDLLRRSISADRVSPPWSPVGD